MPTGAATALPAWHDFYALIGTASATLIGAMFVVASIASRFVTERHLPQVGAFITATVVHLSAVVLVALLVMVPALGWQGLGAILGAGGILGIGYCALGARRVVQHRFDWTDPIWYTALPLTGHGAILAAGLAILLQARAGPGALALGTVLLMVGGIRNSWDMIVYFAARDRGPD